MSFELSALGHLDKEFLDVKHFVIMFIKMGIAAYSKEKVKREERMFPKDYRTETRL
jgi:hypothetical protein